MMKNTVQILSDLLSTYVYSQEVLCWRSTTSRKEVILLKIHFYRWHFNRMIFANLVSVRYEMHTSRDQMICNQIVSTLEWLSRMPVKFHISNEENISQRKTETCLLSTIGILVSNCELLKFFTLKDLDFLFAHF